MDKKTYPAWYDPDVEQVKIQGKSLAIFWSSHAKNRTYDRRSHPKIAAKTLAEILEKLDRVIPNLLSFAEKGKSFIVRAFPYYGYFVLATKQDETGEHRSIRVITYGNVSEFTPRNGDQVISIAPDGSVSSGIWGSCYGVAYNEPGGRVEWGKIS